ncbi:hypothetical protein [uncultured Anaerococcus sp.]|uniref:hypothetical protein n=1 Tax=uncultured Anaerococcus sp. TaxID=293428 RepID=UPI00260FF5C7|nr:hypothetical protein [uncultured Anaerococcus sp.]
MIEKLLKNNKKKVTRSERMKAKAERDQRRIDEREAKKKEFMTRVDTWGYELAKDL